MSNGDLSVIKDYDILMCQVNFFEHFVTEILPRMNTKIVLITSQFEFPQLFRSEFTDRVLNDPRIVLWFSTNPIYEPSEKYVPFPCGMALWQENLMGYAQKLLLGDCEKVEEVAHMHLSPTNPCRELIPAAAKCEIDEYYENIRKARFLISPIGDRDDCYRHYEAIGLGAMPMSNIGEYYRPIFQESMYYCDVKEMVEAIETGLIEGPYVLPNRDLVCFEYYRDYVLKRIEQIRIRSNYIFRMTEENGYFVSLLENLCADSSYDNMLRTIINPFSPYYLCDHFFSYEASGWLGLDRIPGKNNILENHDLSVIKDYDIVQCEVHLFEAFVKEVLPHIRQKIVLLTSQFESPQIYKSEYTEIVRTNPYIVLWISQNPIYEPSDKYMPFPYGITPWGHNLTRFVKVLLEGECAGVEAEVEIAHMFLTETNPCRAILPKGPKYEPVEYYENIRRARYLISPIGDRDDCYRHYEAIGLGAVPISNVGDYYRPIFQDSMYYCGIEEMAEAIETGVIQGPYVRPNRDLICFHYYKDMIMERIEKIKGSYPEI
jgi:hypothetical protein